MTTISQTSASDPQESQQPLLEDAVQVMQAITNGEVDAFASRAAGATKYFCLGQPIVPTAS